MVIAMTLTDMEIVETEAQKPKGTDRAGFKLTFL
jgi:hypothetical protein